MSNFSASSETVTSKARIVQLLTRLQTAHSQLKLTLPGVQRPFSSVLVEVDNAANKLVLDELIPLEGHERIIVDGSFTACGLLEGTTTQFTGCIEEVVTEGKISSYKCPIPGQIDYAQKRQQHRVYISTLPRPKLVLMSANHVAVGEAVNVSAEGAKIQITSEPWFTLNTEVPSCTIEVAGQRSLYCKALIRYLQFEQSSSNWYAGIEFDAFTKSRKKTWAAWVMIMHRKKMRAQVS